MNNFKVSKNGYDASDVDSYIAKLTADYENRLQDQKIRISDMKRELETTKEELDSFKLKNENISDALVVAVETAKQIENGSKNIYALEIKRIRALYDKYESLLNDVMQKYPDIQSEYDTKLLLKAFSDGINEVLNKNEQSIKNAENVAQKEPALSGNIGLKMLINRMSNASVNSVNSSITSLNTKTTKVPRDVEEFQKTIFEHIKKEQSHTIIRNPKPTEDTMAKARVKTVVAEEEKRVHKNQIKPISNVKVFKNEGYDSGLDKFLDEDDDVENNPIAKTILKKKENGFDLQEALNPTEDLEAIMKSFSFYPDKDEDDFTSTNETQDKSTQTNNKNDKDEN